MDDSRGKRDRDRGEFELGAKAPEQKRVRVERPTDSRSVAAAAAAAAPRYADEDGNYLWVKGETLDGRYKVESQLGEGTFGTVLGCHDVHKDRRCAVKVVRNVPKYRDAAMIEIRILKDLRKNFDESAPFVMLWDWFDFRGHICMVFEPLGPSIYDFLSKNSYQGFSVPSVRQMAQQLIEGVRLMHEETQLCHTDLKPENILLVASEYTTRHREVPGSRSGRTKEYRTPNSVGIKLIDFGSATYEDQHHTSVVCTRHYRPPEVVLGLGWSYPCDIWSIGCILVEIYTGEALFQTHDNLEHLALMEARLNRDLPPPLIQQARGGRRHGSKYFDDRDERLHWPRGAKSQSSVDYVRKVQPLSRLIARQDEQFYRLIKEMLRFDPGKRCTAKEALRHPYFMSS